MQLATQHRPALLSLRVDQIRAGDELATSRIWKLFAKCSDSIEQGARLENLSWRTWSRMSCKPSEASDGVSERVSDDSDSGYDTVSEVDELDDGHKNPAAHEEQLADDESDHAPRSRSMRPCLPAGHGVSRRKLSGPQPQAQEQVQSASRPRTFRSCPHSTDAVPPRPRLATAKRWNSHSTGPSQTQSPPLGEIIRKIIFTPPHNQRILTQKPAMTQSPTQVFPSPHHHSSLDHPETTTTTTTTTTTSTSTSTTTPKAKVLTPVPSPKSASQSENKTDSLTTNVVSVPTVSAADMSVKQSAKMGMFYLQRNSPEGSSSGGSHASTRRLTPSTHGISSVVVEQHEPPKAAPTSQPTSPAPARHFQSNKKGKEPSRYFTKSGSRPNVRVPSHATRLANRRMEKSHSTLAPNSPLARSPAQIPAAPAASNVCVRSQPTGTTISTPATREMKAISLTKKEMLPGMALITPSLFDGDKVKPEVLDQRVDAAIKGVTAGRTRRIAVVSSSESTGSEEDDDSSWSDEEDEEDQANPQPRPPKSNITRPESKPLQQNPAVEKKMPKNVNSDRPKSSTEIRTTNREAPDSEGPLARAAREAERQRNMFQKLPRESYSDLRRQGIGAGPSNLTLLLNPDPRMFPVEHPYRQYNRWSRSAGNIYQSSDNISVTGYQKQQPQQQQPAPRQNSTHQRIGGFGGFGFTAMRPVQPQNPNTDPSAPYRRQSQPAPTQAIVPAPPPVQPTKRSQVSALSEQRPKEQPRSAHMTPTSTTSSRRRSAPSYNINLSKSVVLDPVIQQVNADTKTKTSHERPKNRLTGKPVDVELSESEDDDENVGKQPDSAGPPPAPQQSLAQAHLQAVMDGKVSPCTASTAPKVKPRSEPSMETNGVTFPESPMIPRVPPSTPAMHNAQQPIRGEQLPRSPNVRIDRPRPHSTHQPDYHASAAYNQDPYAPQQNGPSTSEPPYSNPIDQFQMPYPYNLPFPTQMHSPRTTRLKMLSSEMPDDLRKDLLWERKANRVQAVFKPLGGLKPIPGNGLRELTEEERANLAAEEARRQAMRTKTWAGVFHQPCW